MANPAGLEEVLGSAIHAGACQLHATGLVRADGAAEVEGLPQMSFTGAIT